MTLQTFLTKRPYSDQSVYVLTYVEIDVPRCALDYGTSPCEAILGVTGAIKCFNSLGTCQDRGNFDDEPVTLRFAMPTSYLPREIDALPYLTDVTFSPGTLSLGEDLGTRTSVKATFSDHPHNDVGQDPYLSERSYVPEKRGTFWGKFRARSPYLQGRSMRVIRGKLGQSLAEMETRNYIIESFSGPDPRTGLFTISARDILKQLDSDRAQCPVINNGFILNAISSSASSLTLSPSGIGNAEYPASGYIALGGKEICGFTRSGDTVTLTSRGQKGTAAQAHSAGDRAQAVKSYASAKASDILYDQLVNFANIPASYIDLADWENEVDTYLQRVYTADIADPVAVKTLVSELIQQAALVLWWDDVAQKIRLQVLRNILTTAGVFSADNTLQNSLTIKDQPEKRVSQVWTYFGLRNPLEPIDNIDNFRSVEATIDVTAEANYGASAIKKIYSRWIPFGGRSVAERLNLLQLGRYVQPPRRINFAVGRFGSDSVALGGGYQIGSVTSQDATGLQINIPAQVTRLSPDADRFSLEAEEVLFTNFDPEDLSTRVIVIDGPANNVNMRTLHDTIYPTPTDEDVGYVTVACTIESGVIIGSVSTSLPAFDVGSWPSGLDLSLTVSGRIQGKGGAGGAGGTGDGVAGSPGGTALKTTVPIDLTYTSGQLWGGGGGGGGGGRGTTSGGFTLPAPGSGGGGGAGTQPGAGGVGPGGQNGSSGTDTNGGANGGSASPGGTGGTGGAPGVAGNNGTGGGGTPSYPGGAGGAAGNSIDGFSHVTIVGATGDRRGPTVN